MNQNTYDSYYWQNEKIRLRLREPSDNKYSYLDGLDSNAMALVAEEVTLPPKRQSVDLNSDSDNPKNEAPAFTIVNHNDEYIGHIHFNYINERHGTFSIGMIIHKPHRRKGYGKAAMKLLFEYAFNERRLNKFSGFCLDDNLGSRKLMESLGCKKEGRSREVVYMNGKYHDQILYGLIKNEYIG